MYNPTPEWYGWTFCMNDCAGQTVYALLGAGAGIAAVASELGIPAVVAGVLGAVASIGEAQIAVCSSLGYEGVSVDDVFGTLIPAC